MKPTIRRAPPPPKVIGDKYTEKKPYSIRTYRGLKPLVASPQEIRWKYSPGYYK